MAGKVSRNRAGENVLCPLFVAFQKNEIWCRPHMPEASGTVQRYNDEAACRMQRKAYCKGNWKRCEHYLSWMHWNWEEE